MKVLVLLEYGIPHYREFIFNYLDELADDFLVIHTGEDYKEVEYNFKTVKCELTMAGIGRLGFHRDVWKYIKNYDVIIGSFNFWRPMCWLPALLSNKKCVLWGQAFGRWDDIPSRIIKRWCARRASSILLYTQKGKEYYTHKLGIRPDKVFVTNNTLDIPNHKLTDGDRHYFLYVGRIQKRKKLSEMIEILSEIRDQDGLEGEIFRIVGDGEPIAELRELVKEKGLTSHVNFIGAVYDDAELIKHFSGALAYVSPGHVGLGVVHSFSYGIPVLTDRTADHAPEFEYCNDRNSFLYSDRSGFKQIVRRLLNDHCGSYQKGAEAYQRYTKNLSADYTRRVFREAILK